MRTHFVFLAIFAAIFSSAVAVAQPPSFNCGSNGSYGPMNIVASTNLQLPPDGIFHCTTVNVAAGTVLRFTPNSLNTPVYILATGDVTIDGQVTVESHDSRIGNSPGAGGAGGFGGGAGSNELNVPAGAGNGPGGGSRGIYVAAPSEQATTHAGNGAYKGTVVGNEPYGQNGSVYGNTLLIPLVGGSGGGGLHLPGATSSSVLGGGGGGGAILIASNTQITFGGSSFINANGGGWSTAQNSQIGRQASAGSGGAIRIVAPKVSGTFTGAVHTPIPVGPGGTTPRTGRIRLDSYDTNQLHSPSNYGPDAIGTVMVIFPNPMPKLSIARAAGTDVAENVVSPVSVVLPSGSTTSQTIRVRARDFGGVVPIRVQLVPENGNPIIVDAQIDNTVANPATVDVPVTMPVGVGVNVMVYTR